MVKNYTFTATESSGPVSAILNQPDSATHLMVLAHGAGAGMEHAFMQAIAEQLAEQKIATLRFNFAYIESGRKSPDIPNKLTKTIENAVIFAKGLKTGLPIIAGGKSLGGRMTSTASSKGQIPDVERIVFFGFPLHAPGRASSDRAAHLYNVSQPMLFLQGTRDTLADAGLMEELCKDLGKNATIHFIDDADHGFHVPKRTGKTDDEIIVEVVKTVKEWLDQ